MTTLVVVSHPDPQSLTQHVARSTADAIRDLGGDVDFADLHAESFDPPRFAEADVNLFRGKGTPPPADVVAEQDRIDRADDLILVFPMYWWSMPALLKGWIDRVFVSGWAYEFTPGSEFVKKLDRLTVHLIPVAGDDAESFDRHGVYEAFRTQIERGIIEYCGATLDRQPSFTSRTRRAETSSPQKSTTSAKASRPVSPTLRPRLPVDGQKRSTGA